MCVYETQIILDTLSWNLVLIYYVLLQQNWQFSQNAHLNGTMNNRFKKEEAVLIRIKNGKPGQMNEVCTT